MATKTAIAMFRMIAAPVRGAAAFLSDGESALTPVPSAGHVARVNPALLAEQPLPVVTDEPPWPLE